MGAISMSAVDRCFAELRENLSQIHTKEFGRRSLIDWDARIEIWGIADVPDKVDNVRQTLESDWVAGALSILEEFLSNKSITKTWVRRCLEILIYEGRTYEDKQSVRMVIGSDPSDSDFWILDLHVQKDQLVIHKLPVKALDETTILTRAEALKFLSQ
jgi:hypothetical protein